MIILILFLDIMSFFIRKGGTGGNKVSQVGKKRRAPQEGKGKGSKKVCRLIKFTLFFVINHIVRKMIKNPQKFSHIWFCKRSGEEYLILAYLLWKNFTSYIQNCWNISLKLLKYEFIQSLCNTMWFNCLWIRENQIFYWEKVSKIMKKLSFLVQSKHCPYIYIPKLFLTYWLIDWLIIDWFVYLSSSVTRR